jgi:ABC-2 type transport system ATP-binding protein
VEEMVALCGLTEEQNKRIGMLSKGYRQRVGLAQALIHDPAVLVLDEPTSGLDPNQLIEIRSLIRKVSEHKTVLFSSHILQEVEALCNRVIVIHKGKIVADDRLEHLLKRGGDQLVVEFDKAPPSMSLEQLPGVNSVVVLAPTKFQIKTDRGVDIRDQVVKLAMTHGLSLRELRQEEYSLESVFGELTQRPA